MVTVEENGFINCTADDVRAATGWPAVSGTILETLSLDAPVRVSPKGRWVTVYIEGGPAQYAYPTPMSAEAHALLLSWQVT